MVNSVGPSRFYEWSKALDIFYLSKWAIPNHKRVTLSRLIQNLLRFQMTIFWITLDKIINSHPNCMTNIMAKPKQQILHNEFNLTTRWETFKFSLRKFIILPSKGILPFLWLQSKHRNYRKCTLWEKVWCFIFIKDCMERNWIYLY